MGGSNNAENLILLCPNCHTEVHKGNISEDELKSLKNSLEGFVNKKIGNFILNEGDYNVLIGSNEYINCEDILIFKGVPIIQLKKENGFLLINLKIYNENGNLIFWMSRNRWWTDLDENFEVNESSKLGKSFLRIDKEGEEIIFISIEDNCVEINFNSYLSGKKYIFNKDSTNFPGLHMKNCRIISTRVFNIN